MDSETETCNFKKVTTRKCIPRDNSRKLATSTFQCWRSTKSWGRHGLYVLDSIYKVRLTFTETPQHVAWSLSLLSHLFVGLCLTVTCYNHTYLHVFSLWHLMSFSQITHFLQIPQRSHSLGKKAKGNSIASKHWTEPFQEFKLLLLPAKKTLSFWLAKGILCLYMPQQRNSQ